MLDAFNALSRAAVDAEAAGAPDDANAAWATRSRALMAAAAMALRTGRGIDLLASSGYSIEAYGLLRRLRELGQLAVSFTDEASGAAFALNWRDGRGVAGRPRKMAGRNLHDPQRGLEEFDLLSGFAHPSMRPFVNLSATSIDTDGAPRFPAGPTRDRGPEMQVLVVTADEMLRVAACFARVYPHVDWSALESLYQRARAKGEEANGRIAAWARERDRRMREAADRVDVDRSKDL